MTGHFTGDAVVELPPRDEKARRAVKAFRTLQPTLTAYAKVLTKNQKVRVELATQSNGMTDGTRIFYRPPIELGDATPHQRNFCDKRDDDLQLLCPACRIREQILVPIYHEIAHIAYDSFQKPTEEEKRKLLDQAVKSVESLYGKQAADRIKNASWDDKHSFLKYANLISQFLPMLLNAIEDARINSAQFKARRGTKIMFDADMRRIIRDGVEQLDRNGEIVYKHYSEYPQNMQVIIGVLCKASGYDYSDWFIPPVVEALNDAKLTELLSQIPTLRSAKASYELAVPVLLRLKELGFLLESRDEPPEPEKGDEGEKDSDGGDAKGDPDSPNESGEADQPNSSKSDSDSDNPKSSDKSNPSASDESDSDESDSSGSDGEAEPSTEEDEVESSGSSESTESDGSSLEEESDTSDESDTSGNRSTGKSDNSDESADSGSSENSDEKESDDESKGNSEICTEDSDGTETSVSDESMGDSKPAPNEDDSLVDTGADEGKGGIELEYDSSWDDVPMGEPHDIEVLEWSGHEDPPSKIKESPREKEANNDAITQAVIQGLYFEEPSVEVVGVREHYYDKHYLDDEGRDYSSAWTRYNDSSSYSRRLGARGEYDAEERILGPVLLKLRVAFSANQRGSYKHHLKSGKINPTVLGKRAYLDDERLFRRKLLPGKRDYFVCIGLDISGSTAGVNIDLIKRAAMAQAELLSRIGIKFAIYAHTGGHSEPNLGRGYGFALDIYHIKDPNEPWDYKTKQRLMEIGPAAANLDGHSLEFYRRLCDTRPETDKIILYFSDGKMPQENFSEELIILQREIKVCKRKNYTLLGVGIRTNSPTRHGLETVQINSVNDLVKVANQLGLKLVQLSNR